MSPPTSLLLDTSMTSAPTTSGTPSTFSHMERVTKIIALGSAGSLNTNNVAEISNSGASIILSSATRETATPSFTQLSMSSASSSTSQSSGTHIRPTKGCWVVAVMIITGLVITN